MRAPLSRVPLLIPTLVFVAGIIAGQFDFSLLWCLAPVGISLILGWKRHVYAAVVVLVFTLGFGDSRLQAPVPVNDSLIRNETTYSGVTITSRETESAQLLVVNIDSVDNRKCRPFLMAVTIPMMTPCIDVTDRVGFRAEITIPTPETDLPDEIDYNSYLIENGVVATALVEPDNITAVTPEPGLLNSLRRHHRFVTRLILTAPFDSKTAEFLNATLTGDDSLMTTDVRQLFSTTGLAHIRALSGLHVGLIALFFSILLFPLHLSGHRYLKNIVIIITLWLFAIMTGLSPSVVRAVIMATLFLIGNMLQRRQSAINSLCFAALAILLVSPSSLYSIGFQLSFIAVAAIVLIADRINPVDRRNVIGRHIMGYATVSIAAMAGTGVVSAYYFHIYPLYFLFANIVAVFLLPFIMSGAIITLIFHAFGITLSWMGKAVDYLCGAVEWWASLISGLPGSTVENIYMHPLSVWLMLGAIAIIIWWLHSRRAAQLAAFGILCAVFIVTGLLLAEEYPEREVYITRHTRSTELLVKDNHRLWLYSTAPEQDFETMIDRCRYRYQDYMGRRGIDSISVMPDCCHTTSFSRNGDVITLPGKTMIFIHGNAVVTPGIKADYAIVCRGFRGDIMALKEIVSADTILLSRDIDVRRHNRYKAQLSEQGIPFRSLRVTSFQMPL